MNFSNKTATFIGASAVVVALAAFAGPMVAGATDVLQCPEGQIVQSVLVTPGTDGTPAVTHVVHHDAVTHQETVIDTPAYDEVIIDVPAHDNYTYAGSNHGDYDVDNVGHNNGSYDHTTGHTYVYVGAGHGDYDFHYSGHNHGDYDKSHVDAVTHTVHHDAVTHDEIVVDVAAYDETVIDVPAVLGTDPVYEDQCVTDPNYVPAETIHIDATKIICYNESDLPNWGAGGPSITASTASDFVAAHPSCHTADWTFQYAKASVTNPGDSFQGLADGWTNFAGSVDLQLPLGTSYLWVREVPQDGYIPFSGWISNGQNEPTAQDATSAEMYCNTDVLNYDNYDRVDPSPAFADGNTYYCVAFNALVTPPPAPTDLCPNIDGTQETVPEGMVVDQDGNCTTPPPPPPTCTDTQTLVDNVCVDNSTDTGGDTGGGDTNTNTGGNSDTSNGGGGGWAGGCSTYANGDSPWWGSTPCGNTPTAVNGGLVLGASTGPSCSALLGSYLGLGKKNNTEDVKKLQTFLNTEMNAGLTVNGIFDQATADAVKAFQLKYWQDVLAPWKPFGLGDHSPTGYVYKTTLRMINNLNCSSLNIPLPILP